MENSPRGAEKLMITKLKAGCGGNFTVNIEGMFRWGPCCMCGKAGLCWWEQGELQWEGRCKLKIQAGPVASGNGMFRWGWSSVCVWGGGA